MPEIIIAGLAIAFIAGLALWRPGAAVMGLGVFLFVQSALVRLESLPDQLTMPLERADEIVLAALLVRTTGQWLLTRNPSALPKPLWALVAFAAIGIVSAIVNGVGLLGTGLGIFLAVKAGLWLYVGSFLKVEPVVLARYVYLIGCLFVGVVGIAVLQSIGVPMPWETTPRAGLMAATSIWNQHTAFGGALSVAVGLSVAAFRLPGERLSATVLLVSGTTGIFLSTARRLLASLAVATVAVLLALPRDERLRMRSWFSMLRRPAVLAVMVVTVGLGAVVVAPRMASVVTYTWEKYVVDLGNRDRYRLYEGAFRLVRESPLVGRGPATYGSYASVVVDSPAYDEVGFRRRNPSMVVGGQLGSLAAEYGILGFAAFAAFLVLLVRALLPIVRRATGTLQAALATGGIFMVTDMVVESVSNPVFSNSFITFFSFVGIGVAMTLHASTTLDGQVDRWDPERLSRGWRMGAFAGAILLLVLLVAVAGITLER